MGGYSAIDLGNEKFAGMWTQKNPYLNPAMIDGINREITSEITDKRRPGSIIYNSLAWSAVRSYFSWKYVQNNGALVRVLVDSTDNTVYDGTGPNTKKPLFGKTAGAGPTRFLGLNTELFFDDGAQQKKIVESALTWEPDTLYDGPDTSDTELGDFIIDPNGNIQQAVGGFSVGITNVSLTDNIVTMTLDTTQLANPQGQPLGVVGSGGSLPSTALYARVAAGNALGLFTAAGSESALTAVVGPNGSVQWTWAPVSGAVIYRLYVGNAPGAENTFFTSSTNTLTQTVAAGTPGTPPTVNNAVDNSLPSNLNQMVGVQLGLFGLTNATFLNDSRPTILTVMPGGDGSNIITFLYPDADYPSTPDTGVAITGNGISGLVPPTWQTALGAVTQDAGVQWINRGSQVQNWGIATPPQAPTVTQQQAGSIPSWQQNTYYSTCGLITDPGGFIQKITTYGVTGSTIPTFNDTTGGTTADGGVIWTCQGPAAYPGGTIAKGAYIEATNNSGTSSYYQAIAGGPTSGSAPSFPSSLNAQVTDGSVIWKNVGIGQEWGDVVTTAVNGATAEIPLAGGGSLLIGMGQNAPNGTSIPLPEGYTTAQLLVWTTGGTGNGGDQLMGMGSSVSISGVLQSYFQLRTSQLAPTTSNYVYVAWQGATLTPTIVSGFTQLPFTTANGDQMVFTLGLNIANTTAIPVPTGGFSAANFIGIAGMATTVPTGNGMYGVQFAQWDPATLVVSADYNDNAGNEFPGGANVCGFFWLTASGVTSTSVTGGTAILIPLPSNASLAITQQTIPNHGAVEYPSGYTGNSEAVTCAMNHYTDGGSTNVAHGWGLAVTAGAYVNDLVDGGGIYSSGDGNIFSLSAIAGNTITSPNTEIDDANGNLQQLQASGVSGGSAPAWSTTAGVLTMDGAATWLNVGQGTAAATAPTFYEYTYRDSVTKHESTASPASVQIQPNAGFGVYVQGLYSSDPQVDTIRIYRPAQGETTAILVDEIRNVVNGPSATWGYLDTKKDTDLNAFIAAPVNHANDPPPANMTAPAYHLQRVWGISGNKVVWSGGPDTLVGSGNEAFPPLNFWPYEATPIKLVPITVQNGALLVYTDGGIFIILGTGTASNPFYSTTYFPSVNLLNYDALEVYNTVHFLMEANGKLSAIAPAYPFDPQSGYVEVGFPVGDQFKTVTTGGITAKLYNPATTFVSWNYQSSSEDALYVADGAVGWFRMSKISPPATGGMTWHPRAAVQGGTSAVQSVETTPGKHQLLIGPPAGTTGPILARDDDATVWDDNGTAYPAWDVKGVNLLNATGAWTEVAHISAKSAAVGARPVVSVLLGEIKSTTTRPWNLLEPTSDDPASTPKSESVFSNRYVLEQNGTETTTDSLQTKFDYGTQAEPDELLDWGVYAATTQERNEPVTA